MRKERIEMLCQDIWDYVWFVLDSEPDCNTEISGVCATLAEHIVKNKLTEWFEEE